MDPVQSHARAARCLLFRCEHDWVLLCLDVGIGIRTPYLFEAEARLEGAILERNGTLGVASDSDLREHSLWELYDDGEEVVLKGLFACRLSLIEMEPSWVMR